MRFTDYIRLREGDESQDDYWAKRMAQFQAAQAGEKGAISDEKGTQGTYHAIRQPDAAPAQEQPIEWVKDNFGRFYEKKKSTDVEDLYFHNTFDRPASDGSYYYLDRASGRYKIRRPGLSRAWR